ncbi:LysE/ArgO family amino acid transporter [Streptomyces sp. NPDC012935]|uniref:LysE/ArgO family amino acid transporter n=1 Tax=Streptomyces sp. NPDC012935 TaxID=3364857 RepID=UPI0036B0C625
MTNALTTAAAGFGTGLSLIVAIGAQNAFVLRQGIRREAVLAVVGICALSDALLITLGVAGVGAVVVAWPGVLTAVAWVGGAFLLCYGALAARRAFKPGGALLTDGEAAGSRRRAVLTCLAMTWLNPHVYLDTVFLLGTVAADRGPMRWTFGLGAVLASLCWFAALGFGARLLSRHLAKPAAWRVLDGLVAATMIVLGATLIFGGGGA